MTGSSSTSTTSHCTYLRNDHIMIELFAKRQIQSKTHITLQFLAFLGMFDLRTVSHTGELQSISLLSVLFLDQIKADYTNVTTIFTFSKNVVLSKTAQLIEPESQDNFGTYSGRTPVARRIVPEFAKCTAADMASRNTLWCPM